MVRTNPKWTVEQLTAIIDSVPTAIVMVDDRGRIVLVNAQAERLFGYSAAELYGEVIEVLVPFRFRAYHPELRAGFIRSPSTRPMGGGRDLFGLHKDGSEFPIEIGLSPIRTEEGLFVVSAIVEISERKQLEARFRATVESAPTAMVMIDQAGTIVLVNAELERLFDYGRGELLRQKIEALIPERFRAGHPALRTQYFAAPEARRMGQGRDLFGLRKDGTEFPIEIGLNPVTTDQGSFVLAAIIDITERTRQAAALRQANEALERSNIELQRFASVASHDLQTPMRSIASFVELLDATYSDKLDAQAKDWIRRTLESIRQLQALIRDLLEYSRVDSRAHPFEPLPLRQAFDQAVTLLEASIREANAAVTCSELPTVMGDRSQLVQLMLNLIGNGIKYRASDPPRVHVSSERVGGEWVICVRDNGIGIAARHHERIFGIFKRLHDQREYPGSGIGLAVCRRVVHRHDGRIWVESEPGHGSRFYFTIPGNPRSAP
jgi:PAS domain S-box-containing protein